MLDEFNKALKASGWTTIVTTQDLVLDDEQLGVGMAVDMDIGRRAAAFIGNGVSELISCLLHYINETSEVVIADEQRASSSTRRRQRASR